MNVRPIMASYFQIEFLFRVYTANNYKKIAHVNDKGMTTETFLAAAHLTAGAPHHSVATLPEKLRCRHWKRRRAWQQGLRHHTFLV